jgi:hypothetical protein
MTHQLKTFHSFRFRPVFSRDYLHKDGHWQGIWKLTKFYGLQNFSIYEVAAWTEVTSKTDHRETGSDGVSLNELVQNRVTTAGFLSGEHEIFILG